MDSSGTRYARTPDGSSIAYQVIGDGPVDLLWIFGWHGNLEIFREQPLVERFLAGLASFARVIIHDRRATGLSDRAASLPDLETRVDDVRSVLDAVGSQSTIILGTGDGGHAASLFAATYPKRTRRLLLYAMAPRATPAPDYPWGYTERERAHELQMARESWGTDAGAAMVLAQEAPSKTTDRDFVSWYAKLMRHWVSPTSAEQLHQRYFDTDIRAVLATITVPTLVLARDWEDKDEDLYTVDLIPGASFKQLSGEEAVTYLDPGDLTEAIRDFIGASQPRTDHDSMLRTVVFTDIIDSTQRAAELGDAGWRDVIEAHRSQVRDVLRRLGGSEVDTAGDGFFAVFEGPTTGVRAAGEIVGAARALDIEIRAGVHAGEVTSIEGKFGGIAAHIGSRVCGQAGPSEVLVSRTVRDLVAGSGLVLEDAGTRELKGIAEPWQLFRVIG